jgi:hypothetical protein
MRLALGELVGRFLPVTDATFWSDTVGAPKERAAMIAVNHARAQILAPHTDVDLWVGLDRSAGRGTESSKRASAWPASEPLAGAAAASLEPGVAGSAQAEPDPWGASAAPDPWGFKTGPVPAPAAALGAAPPAPVPSTPSVPPSRTGLLGRVHGTVGGALELPRPVDGPDGWRGDDR